MDKMNILELRLLNYRNFENEMVSLHPSVNIISGNNAEGKTNLIESIFYLSTLRPVRPVKDRELISRGCGFAKLEAAINGAERAHTLEVTLSQTERKRMVKNGVVQKKASDFIGTLRTVLFSPDDMNLIKETSVKRRRMVDIALCQLRPNYLIHLSEYNRALEQKSRLLRSIEEKPSLVEMIPAYNERLAVHGANIIAYRHRYLQQLRQHSAAVAEAISGGKDRMDLRYVSLSNIPDTSLPAADLAELIRAHQKSHYQAELASKTCLSGPHKDDFEVSVNGTAAKSFASQGQIRTAVLSLKLAERDIAQKDSGEYPVLLLDDVLSELDGDRQNFVLNRINSGQVVISSCTMDKYAEISKGRLFKIRNGSVVHVQDI